MPLPAPVTTATWPVNGFATAPLSLACSRLQYSTSNRSASRQRLEAADRLGIGDDPHRVLGQVGGDGRILGRGADAEQADARHQHHARHGVELGLDAADAARSARANMAS